MFAPTGMLVRVTSRNCQIPKTDEEELGPIPKSNQDKVKINRSVSKQISPLHMTVTATGKTVKARTKSVILRHHIVRLRLWCLKCTPGS